MFPTKFVSIPLSPMCTTWPPHLMTLKHVALRIISLLSLTLAAQSTVKTAFSISRTDSVSSNPIWNLNDCPRFYILCCVGKGLTVIRLQAQGAYQFLKHSRFQKFTEMLEIRRLHGKSFLFYFQKLIISEVSHEAMSSDRSV